LLSQHRANTVSLLAISLRVTALAQRAHTLPMSLGGLTLYNTHAHDSGPSTPMCLVIHGHTIPFWFSFGNAHRAGSPRTHLAAARRAAPGTLQCRAAVRPHTPSLGASTSSNSLGEFGTPPRALACIREPPSPSITGHRRRWVAPPARAGVRMGGKGTSASQQSPRGRIRLENLETRSCMGRKPLQALFFFPSGL
jgi:hypothetical protein